MSDRRARLTERQRQALDLIVATLEATGSSPSLAAIAAQMGITSPSAHQLLRALERKGYIWAGRTATSPFAIALRDSEPHGPTTPILGGLFRRGRVRWLGRRSRLGHVLFLFATDPRNCFFLYIRSDLRRARFHQGEMLIFDVARPVAPGEMVLLISGEAGTIKGRPEDLARLRVDALVARYQGRGLRRGGAPSLYQPDLDEGSIDDSAVRLGVLPTQRVQEGHELSPLFEALEPEGVDALRQFLAGGTAASREMAMYAAAFASLRYPLP